MFWIGVLTTLLVELGIVILWYGRATNEGNLRAKQKQLPAWWPHDMEAPARWVLTQFDRLLCPRRAGIAPPTPAMIAAREVARVRAEERMRNHLAVLKQQVIDGGPQGIIAFQQLQELSGGTPTVQVFSAEEAPNIAGKLRREEEPEPPMFYPGSTMQELP